jgi:SOS-response transcriptional repressor LexA
MTTEKHPEEWVRRIQQLRKRLSLNQSEFAALLKYSPMAICRWEKGSYEPTAKAYVQIGNLADGKESSWFWARAGLKSGDLSRMFPKEKSFLNKVDFPEFEFVIAGSGGKRVKTKTKLVAIPVLAAHAGTHGEKGDQVLDLADAEISEMIAAPVLWCPNPATTSCLRVRGSSMSPTIEDGDVVVVDSAQNDPKELDGKIVVAWHKGTGLTLSRFLMMKGVQLLESENRDYSPISMAGDRNWRIVGKVLWWIRKAA